MTTSINLFIKFLILRHFPREYYVLISKHLTELIIVLFLLILREPLICALPSILRQMQ